MLKAGFLITRLIYLKGFFKVVVFLQKEAIVHDDLWCGYPQVNDPVIHCLTRLQKYTVYGNDLNIKIRLTMSLVFLTNNEKQNRINKANTANHFTKS